MARKPASKPAEDTKGAEEVAKTAQNPGEAPAKIPQDATGEGTDKPLVNASGDEAATGEEKKKPLADAADVAATITSGAPTDEAVVADGSTIPASDAERKAVLDAVQSNKDADTPPIIPASMALELHLRVATAAWTIERDGVTYTDGMPIPLPRDEFERLSRVRAVLETDWDALEEAVALKA